MKKYLCILWIGFHAVCAFSGTSVKVITPQEGYSAEAVIANIEATYDYNAPAGFRLFHDKDFALAEDGVINYLASVKGHYDRAALEERLYELMMDASQEDFGEEKMIRYSSIYLMSNYHTYASIAYQVMATAYANLHDRENLRFVLHCFEHSDINANGEYDDLIERMRNQMNSILHSGNFAENMKGFWVTNSCSDPFFSGAFPSHMMEIRALTDDGIFSYNIPGGSLLDTESSICSTYRYAQRISFDNPSVDNPGRLSVVFSSEHLQRGTYIEGSFEETRKFRADMAGEIAASDASFGTKLGVSAATTAVAGFMDFMTMYSAQSYHTITTATVTLTPIKEDVLHGHISALGYTFNTMNPYAEPPAPSEMDYHYLHWLPEDSVYFVNTDGRLVTLIDPKYMDTSEYDRLASSWRKIQLGASISCLVVGAGMAAGGIAWMVTKPSTLSIAVGIPVGAIGLATAIAVPSALFTIPPRKRYVSVNEHQMQKLKDKRNPPVIEVAPKINPWDASGGFSMKVTY